MTARELDEVSRSLDDRTLVGRADHGDASAASELEQALLAEGAEDGVGVHAEDRGEVLAVPY